MESPLLTERVRVCWKWEGEDDDGESVGPVVIERPDGSNEHWDGLFRQSVACAYAEAHRYELVADL